MTLKHLYIFRSMIPYAHWVPIRASELECPLSEIPLFYYEKFHLKKRFTDGSVQLLLTPNK